MAETDVRALVERYPYLMPRNVFTDEIPEDYDYSYTKAIEVPRGWYRLFLQMCEDIRQPLIDADYLDKFRFLQVKEKYNTLRCYHNGALDEVDKIIQKYEQMAYYVCTVCGKPAEVETQGYFASFCNDCINEYEIYGNTKPIKFKDSFKVTRYEKGKEITFKISFKEEWERYLKGLEV